MKRFCILIAMLLTSQVSALTERELDQHVQSTREDFQNIELVLSIDDHRPGEGTTESQVTLVWDIQQEKIHGTQSTLLQEFSQELTRTPKKKISPFSTKIGENMIPQPEFVQDHVKKRKYVLNDVHAWSLSNRLAGDREIWKGNKWSRKNARILTGGSIYGRQIEGDLFLPELHMAFDFYHRIGDLYDNVFMYGQSFVNRTIKPADEAGQWWLTQIYKHRVGQVKYRYLLEVNDGIRILETHQSIRIPDEGEVPMLSIVNTWNDGKGRSDFPEKIVVQHLIDNNLIARTVTISVLGAILNGGYNLTDFEFQSDADSNVIDHTRPKLP